MKKKISLTTWIGIAASALMLALLIMQFIPYWVYQGESVSIAEYVMFPHKYNTFTTLFRSYFGKKYRINLVFGLPMTLTMVGNLIGCILCTVKSSKAACYLIPVASGAIGMFGLIASQPYRLSGLWMPMLILYGVLLAVGIAGLVIAAIRSKKKPVSE